MGVIVSDLYDPLEPLTAFVARRPGQRQSVRARPTASAATAILPPFGTRDGRLVRYIVLLDDDLDRRVAQYLDDNMGLSFGQLAFEAITTRLHEIRSILRPDPRVPFNHLRTHRPRPIATGSGSVRRTARLTIEQANAVQDIRESLGRIEMGQLHRLAFDLHVP